MKLRFEWDPAKSLANLFKHGISFDHAANLFHSSADCLEIFDVKHSEDEDRFITIGPIDQVLAVVVWTELEDDMVRIISARSATKRERHFYHRHMEHRKR